MMIVGLPSPVHSSHSERSPMETRFGSAASAVADGAADEIGAEEDGGMVGPPVDGDVPPVDAAQAVTTRASMAGATRRWPRCMESPSDLARCGSTVRTIEGIRKG